MVSTPDALFAAPAGDLLAAEPVVLTGYAHVSTQGQLLDRQITALDYLPPGDTLAVLSLDRLARSLQDLIQIVADLRGRGVGFRSLKEVIDTTTPGGRLVFHVFAALAEFIRELIVEGTNEGLAAAKARSVKLGRPRQ